MALKFSETLKGASVFALISSTLTPSACSISVKPSVKSTWKTAYTTAVSITQLHTASDTVLHLPTP